MKLCQNDRIGNMVYWCVIWWATVVDLWRLESYDHCHQAWILASVCYWWGRCLVILPFHDLLSQSTSYTRDTLISFHLSAGSNNAYRMCDHTAMSLGRRKTWNTEDTQKRLVRMPLLIPLLEAYNLPWCRVSAFKPADFPEMAVLSAIFCIDNFPEMSNGVFTWMTTYEWKLRACSCCNQIFSTLPLIGWHEILQHKKQCMKE